MGRGSSTRARAGRYALHVVVLATLVTGVSATSVARAAGPTITLTPSTALVSGQTVTVAGSGFFAGESLIALACPRGTTDPNGCDFGAFVEVVSNSHGRFSTMLTVHRTIATNAGFTDCAPAVCEVVFADTYNFSDQAVAPVEFDATVPLPTTSLKVTPSTGLGDRETVTISGTGFSGDRQVFAIECVTGSFSCLGGFPARADASGSFSIVGSVHRNLYDINGNPVDCASAAGTCEMLAYDPLNADYHRTKPLAFDPSLPPPPPSTLTVNPADNLPYYARVKVHGKRWAAGDLVLIMQCPNAAQTFNCFNLLGFTQVRADGTISFDPLLTRKLVDPFSGTVDCVKRNRCAVVAQDFADNSSVTVPVTFDPAAPIPPRPRVNVSPAAPYTDGQTVTVNGRNFPPNALYGAAECFSTTNFFGCFLPKGPGSSTDANGGFSTSVTLRRFVRFSGQKYDCADVSVTCSLSAFSEGGVQVDTPLQFSATAAASPAADVGTVAFSQRPGSWAAATPRECSGMRMSPHVALKLADQPRLRAQMCAAWAQTLQH